MTLKPFLIALSVIGFSTSIPSFAQNNVTLYGSIDTSLNYTTNANAAGASVTGINSGSFLPSTWGIFGSEDLGDGMRAFFRLENSFNADTGAVATTTSFFNRFAYVGLSNNFGSVSAGRLGSMQYDYTIVGGYDPLYGSTYGLSSLNAIPIQTLKLANSVKYVSPNFSGVTAAAMYSFGQEQAGNSRAGRYWGAALEYAHNNFRTRVIYENSNGNVANVDQSSLADKRLSIAARYDIGPFELFADYVKISGSLHISPAGSIYMGSVGYKISPALRVVVQGGQYNFDLGSKTRLAGAFVSYNLSKRTMLYTSLTRIINGENSNFGLVYATTMSTPGQGQTAAAMGIRHAF